MGRTIIKLNGYYFEYSSISDCPVTLGMSLDEFKRYYRDTYGTNGMQKLQEKLSKVEATGTSSQINKSAEDALATNRAGPNGDRLSMEEMYQAYCLRVPIRGDWLVPVVDDDEVNK